MPLQRYIQRPEQIEAMPAHEILDAAAHDWASLPEWIRDAYDTERLLLQEDTVIISTALGRHPAKGDDVVFFQGGGLKTVPAAQFAAMFAPAPAEDVTP